MTSRWRLLRTWHCKHGRLVAAYFSGLRCPDLHTRNVIPREYRVNFEKKIAKRRENSRGEVSESFTDLPRMISSARPCGVGETPHLNGGAGSGAQRRNNYHHECNYFGRN